MHTKLEDEAIPAIITVQYYNKTICIHIYIYTYIHIKQIHAIGITQLENLNKIGSKILYTYKIL